MSDTSARSSHRSVFKSVDFHALGLPSIASGIDSSAMIDSLYVLVCVCLRDVIMDQTSLIHLFCLATMGNTS